MEDKTLKRQVDIEQLVAEYVATQRADIRDLLIVHCAQMVERIARKFAGVEPVEDLAQVGYIGLLNALSKFDPNAGVRFNTYASHLVAGEIKHYLRDRAMTIRHPAWLQELRHKVKKTAVALQAETGSIPNARAIAERIGVSEQAVEEVFATEDLLRVGSLDSNPSEDGGGESEADRLDASLVVGEHTSVEDRVLLEQAMEQLRELEREVLVLFHFETLNQTEIAAKLGISCNYVSHILRQSLSKLRRILSSDEAVERTLRQDSESDSRSITDQETGLYTSAYFKSRLSEELHRVASLGGSVGLIRIAIHGLTARPGSAGAQSVSELVQDAAYSLKATTRSLDVVCREGKFSFAVILPGHGERVSVACERIETEMQRWLASRVSPTSKIQITFGMANGPEDGDSANKLVEAAEPSEPFELRIAS